MNKPLFFTGLVFFILEALIFAGIFLSQVSLSKETLYISAFGLFNLLFAVILLIGALKD
jgi:hypothetical protein